MILNPASGGGRVRKSLDRIRAAFDQFQPDYLTTTRAGEEERLAREAAAAGIETIVVVGGDGTWGNAAHGIVQSGARPRVALLAAGTGNDFVKSLGAPADDPAAMAQLIRSGAERLVDVGRVDGRVFLNCLGVGFDASVLARTERMHGIQGPLRYLAAALAELFSYRSEPIHIEPWTGAAGHETLLLVFANGAWYGGMFHIAPGAAPDDGMLMAVRVSDMRGLRRLGLLASAVRGGHVASEGVEISSGARFSLSCNSPPLLNTDGELRRATSAELEVTVEPGALRIVAPGVRSE